MSCKVRNQVKAYNKNSSQTTTAKLSEMWDSRKKVVHTLLDPLSVLGKHFRLPFSVPHLLAHWHHTLISLSVKFLNICLTVFRSYYDTHIDQVQRHSIRWVFLRRALQLCCQLPVQNHLDICTENRQYHMRLHGHMQLKIFLRWGRGLRCQGTLWSRRCERRKK